MTIASLSAHAQFVPAAGYSGHGIQAVVAAPSDPSAPALVVIPNAAVSGLVHIDRAYKRGAATALAKVVGVFAVTETTKTRFVSAWSPGFLPVFLSFSDGRCYLLQAKYEGGTLSNGRLINMACEGRRSFDERVLPLPPPSLSLRLVGKAWGYAAWANDRAGLTIISAPFNKTFQPLFTVQMTTRAIMAMDGPDSPSGNVTLVGVIKDQLTIMTLEVGY